MNEELEQEYGGILLTPGTKLSIPPGGLTIGMNDQGEFGVSVAPAINLEMFPVWLNISFEHLIEAEESRKKLILCKKDNKKDDLRKFLLSEFTSGMQSMMSSAIAIDAFYASIKNIVTIPENLRVSWQNNRTARYKQISEVFKMFFKIKQEDSNKMREMLKNVYRFRDWAVHPPSEQQSPILHEELNYGVEWRFIAFDSINARNALQNSLSILYYLLRTGEANDKLEVTKFCKTFLPHLDPIKKEWERKYSEL